MLRSTPPPPEPAEAAVLLVDDKLANLVALQAVLEPLGCTLVQARSGEEALRELLRREFALVLLDMLMPGMSGLETAALIKARPATQAVPIIFLTAHSVDNPRLLQAYAQGAADVLVKPLDPQIVRAKVAVFVELYVKHREIERRGEIILKREREASSVRALYEAERLARAHAEAAARAREQVLAIVSHDLRNPLAAATACLELIARQAADPQRVENVQEQVRRAKRSLAAMEQLVSDLLDIARVESGHAPKPPLIDTDLAELVREVAEVLHPLVVQKQQELQLVTAPCRIGCDRPRVAQVLMNLLGNAIKFTPTSGALRVELVDGEREVSVTIDDSGPGVPAAEAERIFDAFRQGEGERSGSEGFGLGLAIARSAVQAHGGRIGVEPSDLGGSRFWFTLPRRRESAEPSESNDSSEPSAPNDSTEPTDVSASTSDRLALSRTVRFA